jgi:hypothetical protein
MDNESATAFELIPQTLVDSGRKQQLDYPSGWYVSGQPYAFEGDWRTMMHENVSADRIKNLTIKNCVTDSNFYGNLFQIFSVDGVYVYDSQINPNGHSALRFWHSTDIRISDSGIGGSGEYGSFLFKCFEVSYADCRINSTGGSRSVSFKGAYHGTNSIFVQNQIPFVDMAIKITDCEFINNNSSGAFTAIDTGGDPNDDVIGNAGGTPIGFTKLEWLGNGVKNIVNTESRYNSNIIRGIFDVIYPCQDVTISRNNGYNARIGVQNCDGAYIEDNILDFNPADTTNQFSKISFFNEAVWTGQPICNSIRIFGNTIKNIAGNNADESIQAILVRGTNVDVSNNRLEFPRGGVKFFANIDNVSADFISGDNNIVYLGSSAIDFETDRPVKTETGANLHGGTVSCGVVNTVTDIVTGVFNSRQFGDAINVVGLTTAGTCDLGTRAAHYTIINNLCFFEIQVPWNNLTGTGDLAITGMPFAVDNRDTSNYRAVFNVIASGLTFSGTQLVAFMLPNEDFIRIGEFSSGGGLSAVGVDSDATLIVTGFYPYKP